MNYIFLLLFLPFSLSAEIIIVYGASCAGKSTLAKGLMQALQNNWTLLDRDVIELELIDEKAVDERLIREIDQAILLNQNVIVDLQDPAMILNALQNSLQDSLLHTIFVYAPLKHLLERDEARTIRRNRTPHQQYRAKSFVINTYAALLSTEPGGAHIGSIAAHDTPEEVFSYYLSDHSMAFYTSVIAGKQLFAKNRCDVLIRSHQETLAQSLEKVLSSLYHVAST